MVIPLLTNKLNALIVVAKHKLVAIYKVGSFFCKIRQKNKITGETAYFSINFGQAALFISIILMN